MTSELGPWEPLPLVDTIALLRLAPFRWWVCGGHALELHLGRSWREHDDIDIGISLADAPALHSWLSSMEAWIAAAGVLHAWDGRGLVDDHDEHNLWVRQTAADPWGIDVTVGAGTMDEWVCRRDPFGPAALGRGCHDLGRCGPGVAER